MWIQAVDGELVNLNLTGGIRVAQIYYGANDEKFSARAETPVASEVSSVYADLFIGSKEECREFINMLAKNLNVITV